MMAARHQGYISPYRQELSDFDLRSQTFYQAPPYHEPWAMPRPHRPAPSFTPINGYPGGSRGIAAQDTLHKPTLCFPPAPLLANNIPTPTIPTMPRLVTWSTRIPSQAPRTALPYRETETAKFLTVPTGAIPPELPPSVEAAYRKKCIQLKIRMNEVEEANDAQRQRLARIHRSIQKLRMERAFLLEQLAKRTSTNVEDSEGSPSPPPTVRLPHPSSAHILIVTVKLTPVT